jgi:hypothetical protein
VLGLEKSGAIPKEINDFVIIAIQKIQELMKSF